LFQEPRIATIRKAGILAKLLWNKQTAAAPFRAKCFFRSKGVAQPGFPFRVEPSTDGFHQDSHLPSLFQNPGFSLSMEEWGLGKNG